MMNGCVCAASDVAGLWMRARKAGKQTPEERSNEQGELSLIARLADAVYLAASELENEGEISAATWNVVADAVGPGPLQGLVEQVR